MLSSFSPSSTLSSSDSFVTSKVKSALAGAANVSVKDVKVITERGTTYLMGRVTAAEAEAATEAVRTVGGVERVIRVFEYVAPGQADANVVPTQPSYPRTTPTQLGDEGAAKTSPAAAPAARSLPAAPAPAPAVRAPAPVAPASVPSAAPAPASQVQSLPPLEPAQSSPVTNSPLR